MVLKQTQLFPFESSGCVKLPETGAKKRTSFRGSYSHTKLSVYENCPLCYNYKYIEKPEHPIPFTSIEAFMGSRVHETLEYLYKQIFHSPESGSDIHEILCYYKDAWNKKMSDDVKVVKEGMTALDYFEQGEKILKDYFELHAPFSEDRTLFETDNFNKEKPFLEKRVDIVIDGYKLMGFVDRIAEKEDGTILIHDYKTSGTLPAVDTLKNDRQLALYRIALDEKYPDAPKELVYHYLKFNQDFYIMRSDEEIEQLKKDVVALIRKIEKATEEKNFPAVVTSRCAWCEFATICPAKVKKDAEGQS